MYRHLDGVTVSGKSFVYGVVDDFINQMMKTHITGRTDVHCRSFANRFSSFKDADGRRVVGSALFACYRCTCYCQASLLNLLLKSMRAHLSSLCHNHELSVIGADNGSGFNPKDARL